MATLAAALACGLAIRASFPNRDFSDSRYFPRQEKDFPSRTDIETQLNKSLRSLEQDPADLKALTASGIAYYAMGREHAVEALNRLEAARDYGAVDYRIFYYLGRLYSLISLPQFAAMEYERFLRNSPQDRETLLELGRIYYELGLYARSAGFYEILLEMDGARKKDPLVVENLALAALKMGNWEKSKSLFESLRSESNLLSEEISFFLGEIHRGLDQCDQALPLYAEALQPALESAKKIAILEGKLFCLEKLPHIQSTEIALAAQDLLQVDPKNDLARRAARKYRNVKRKT